MYCFRVDIYSAIDPVETLAVTVEGRMHGVSCQSVNTSTIVTSQLVEIDCIVSSLEAPLFLHCSVHKLRVLFDFALARL